MGTLKLTERQKKDILKSFKEIDMHNELKILFEKMYPDNTNVYNTHGKEENGKDIIISKNDPLSKTLDIAVVVKMDKLSGTALDKPIQEIRNQVEQSFERETYIKENNRRVKADKVFIFIFGEVSNQAEKNLHTNLIRYEGRYEIKNIDDIVQYFSKSFPEVFYGASGLEALNAKYNELEESLKLKKNIFTENYIEPLLKFYQSGKKELISISKSSDEKKANKEISDSLFGKKKSIDNILHECTKEKKFIYIEGDAGSGKSVLSYKLIMSNLDNAIKKLKITKTSELEISAPVLLTATELKNGQIYDLDNIIKNFYNKSSIKISTNIIIVDGIDEVTDDNKDNIIKEVKKYCDTSRMSMIVLGRKNTETKQKLSNFNYYELLSLEKSQVINYIKSTITKNDKLLHSLISGLEVFEHQIPLYPMTLIMLIEIIKQHNEIPASISELYERYCDIVLGKNIMNTDIEIFYSYQIKKDFLKELAYKCFYEHQSVEISLESFDNFLNDYVLKHTFISSKEDFIEDLKRVDLIQICDKVKFSHKSFLDFFIAKYFVERASEINNSKVDDIYKLYTIPLWEDVTYFFIGIRRRITKEEINKIITAIENSSDHNLIKLLNQFMLGKLIQYGWNTDTEEKKFIIKNAAKNSIELQEEKYKFLVDDLGFNIPKIASNAAMLHLCNLSFSSNFLRDDIFSIISDKFEILNNSSASLDEEDSSIVYFSALFLLADIKNIPIEKSEYIIENLTKMYLKLDPKIALPIFGLLKIFTAKGAIKIDVSYIDKISLINKKLIKKYSKFARKIFLFKNAIDKQRLNELTKK